MEVRCAVKFGAAMWHLQGATLPHQILQSCHPERSEGSLGPLRMERNEPFLGGQ